MLTIQDNELQSRLITHMHENRHYSLIFIFYIPWFYVVIYSMSMTFVAVATFLFLFVRNKFLLVRLLFLLLIISACLFFGFYDLKSIYIFLKGLFDLSVFILLEFVSTHPVNPLDFFNFTSFSI